MNPLYIRPLVPRFILLMDFDMNWWGIIAFPIGTLICFGPVIVAWILACREDKSAPQASRKDRR